MTDLPLFLQHQFFRPVNKYENTKAGVTAGVIVLTVFVPGPEDLVLAAVYSKYGIRIVRQGTDFVVTRFGRRIDGAQIDEVKALVEKEAKSLGNILNSPDYMVHKSYNDAIANALAWLKNRGFQPASFSKSKWASCNNGMVDTSGTIGYRIEFDERIGAHINVFSGKEKGPHFVFPSTESELNALLRQLFKE